MEPKCNRCGHSYKQHSLHALDPKCNVWGCKCERYTGNKVSSVTPKAKEIEEAATTDGALRDAIYRAITDDGIDNRVVASSLLNRIVDVAAKVVAQRQVQGVAAVRDAWAALREAIKSPHVTHIRQDLVARAQIVEEAIAALDAPASASELTWTTGLPTVAGWYWIGVEDEHSTKWASHFFNGCGQFKFTDQDGAAARVDYCDWRGYKFAGPIPEPKAAMDKVK